MSPTRYDSFRSILPHSQLLRRSLAIGSGSVLLAYGRFGIASAQAVPQFTPPPASNPIVLEDSVSSASPDVTTGAPIQSSPSAAATDPEDPAANRIPIAVVPPAVVPSATEAGLIQQFSGQPVAPTAEPPRSTFSQAPSRTATPNLPALAPAPLQPFANAEVVPATLQTQTEAVPLEESRGSDRPQPETLAESRSPAQPIFEPPYQAPTAPSRIYSPAPLESAPSETVPLPAPEWANQTPSEPFPNSVLLAATQTTTDLGLLPTAGTTFATETAFIQNVVSDASSSIAQLPPSDIPGSSSAELLRSTALTPPTLRLQGVYLVQDDEGSGRIRVSGTYPLTPRLLLGASIDATEGEVFNSSEGLSINELFLATSLADLPNLRFVIGQIDLTSYFDRNSFAKDAASHFFNPAFQTNPALSAANISSRPGLLLNWTLTDNLEARAAAFSSAEAIGDFALDGFAGEVAFRYGNALIRGTYVSSREGGGNDGFNEIFQIDRGNGITGPLSDDREEAYGLNAEVFIPDLNMGIFGRYGRYDNRDLGEGGDTYSFGVTFLDLFAPDDRLGLAYGRQLSNNDLRLEAGDRIPDVVEAYYDFRFSPFLRLGFTAQKRNDFSETVFGFRIRTDLNILNPGG